MKHQKTRKMKKTFRMFGMILFVMLMIVGFSACSSDDDDDNNPSIVGTWYVENKYYSGTDGEYTEYVEVTYKKDGTVIGYWKDTYNGKEEVETDTGIYDVIKDVLRVWWASEADENLADDPWTVTFSINGNKMTTSENGGTVWTRK